MAVKLCMCWYWQLSDNLAVIRPWTIFHALPHNHYQNGGDEKDSFPFWTPDPKIKKKHAIKYALLKVCNLSLPYFRESGFPVRYQCLCQHMLGSAPQHVVSELKFKSEIAITFDLSCKAISFSFFSFLLVFGPEVAALLLDWSHSR